MFGRSLVEDPVCFDALLGCEDVRRYRNICRHFQILVDALCALYISLFVQTEFQLVVVRFPNETGFLLAYMRRTDRRWWALFRWSVKSRINQIQPTFIKLNSSPFQILV